MKNRRLNLSVTRTAPPPIATSICAVVVTFFPDQAINDRIKILLRQVGLLIIIDNTPEKDVTERFTKLQAEFGNTIDLIKNPINMGVSTALNQGLQRALKLGFTWILTLDQDTNCNPDMIRTLLNVYDRCDVKPSVIGSNYYDPQSKKLKVAQHGEDTFLVQKTVITSGSLVDAVLARDIGGFRDDYFIDQLDHEFCLRVRAHGGRVVISRSAVMQHSVGRLGGVRVPWTIFVLPDHPPIRKYYIARNTVTTIAAYWLQEPMWCVRRGLRLLLGALSMLLFETQGFIKVTAFVCGITDGIRGEMGPCRYGWLYRVS